MYSLKIQQPCLLFRGSHCTNCCPETSCAIFGRPLVEAIRRFQGPKLWLKHGRLSIIIFQAQFVQEPCGGYKFPLGLGNYDVVATCNGQSISEHQFPHIGVLATLSAKNQKESQAFRGRSLCRSYHTEATCRCCQQA